MDKLEEFLTNLTVEYANNGYAERYQTLLDSAFSYGWHSYHMEAQYEPLLIAIEDYRIDSEGLPYLGIPNGWPKTHSGLSQFIAENWAVGNQNQIWGVENPEHLERKIVNREHHMNSWFITQWDMENKEPLKHAARLVGLNDIPPGERYIFPISINGSAHFFLDSVLEMGVWIPPRVVEDTKNGLAKIVFHEVYEGHGFNNLQNGPDAPKGACVRTFLEANARSYGIPFERMAFLDANYFTPTLQAEYGSKGFYYPYWENHVGAGHMWHDQRTLVNSHIQRMIKRDMNYEYNLIHLNRRARWHRALTTTACFYRWRDLPVLWSYTEPDRNWLTDWHRTIEQDLINAGVTGQDYLDAMPKLIDCDRETNDTFLNCDMQYRAYVNFTNETMFVEPNTMFFSEKMFKPILACQPFILSGNAGSLKHLRELGYKTFHPYIDESYDLEANPAKRMSMLLAEAERIARMSPAEIKLFMSRVAPICIHNYDTINQRMDNCIPMIKIINELYHWVQS